MNCGAVILAGGASQRMGRPKALLPLGDSDTFASRLIRTFSSICSPVLLVAGHHAPEIRAAMPEAAGAGVILDNPDPTRGQFSSLQCGLAALAGSAVDAFFFHPVDSPLIRAETLQRLLGALEGEAEALLAIPRFEGRRGHPVLCRAGLREEFLNLPATAQARQVVHGHVAETVYVDVEDPGILADIDEPADYERLVAAGARQQR